MVHLLCSRHQDRHLGILTRQRRNAEEPVNVYIHSLEKKKQNGDENVEVLYHVSVAGKPVLAFTAAEDMALVPDEVVVKELGYPFVIKAERKFNTSLRPGCMRIKSNKRLNFKILSRE